MITFGTGGWRAIIGDDFTKANLQRVAHAVARRMIREKVDKEGFVIGYDRRFLSRESAIWFSEVIAGEGIPLYFVNLSAPTPQIMFTVKNMNLPYGAAITASHNPKGHNGMKVSRTNALPVALDTGLGTLKQWMEEGRPMPVADRRGTVHEMDIRKEYVGFQLGYKKDISNLKIGMDLSNGMASILVRDIFGDQPLYICEELDGTFPNHDRRVKRRNGRKRRQSCRIHRI